MLKILLYAVFHVPLLLHQKKWHCRKSWPFTPLVIEDLMFFKVCFTFKLFLLTCLFTAHYSFLTPCFNRAFTVIFFFKAQPAACSSTNFLWSFCSQMSNKWKDLQVNVYLTRCSVLLILQTIPKALSHCYQRGRSKNWQFFSLNSPVWHRPFVADINSVQWSSVSNMLLFLIRVSNMERIRNSICFPIAKSYWNDWNINTNTTNTNLLLKAQIEDFCVLLTNLFSSAGLHEIQEKINSL